MSCPLKWYPFEAEIGGDEPQGFAEDSEETTLGRLLWNSTFAWICWSKKSVLDYIDRKKKVALEHSQLVAHNVRS